MDVVAEQEEVVISHTDDNEVHIGQEAVVT